MNEHHIDTPHLEELPSPEELFGTINFETPTLTSVRRHTPTYKFKRGYRLLFFMVLVGVAIVAATLGNRTSFHLYTVRSSDMEKVLPKGSILLIKEVLSAELKAGDIITYENEENVSVTHTISTVIPSSNGEGYAPTFRVTSTVNPDINEHEISYSDIYGKVILYLPYLGLPYVWLTDAFHTK